jgi:hypothetical protein
MINIDLAAKAVASVVQASGKFGADEQKAALTMIGKEASPADLVDTFSRIGNVSAVRQELEKCGVLKVAPADHSAFQRAVLHTLETLRTAKK